MNQIQENIQIIAEMLSVSDEVITVSNTICDTINRDFKNQPYEKYNKDIFTRSGSFQQTLWGYDVTVNYTVYDIMGRYDANEIAKEWQLANSFEFNPMSLSFELIAINDILQPEYSQSLIYHEVEHCYQWSLNKTNNPKFKSLTNGIYNYARDCIMGQERGDSYKIACLVYYSNPREQDAFIHEYYAQAKQSPSKFKNRTTEVDVRYEHFGGLLDWFESCMFSPRSQQIIKPYIAMGYTANHLHKYFIQGYDRFTQKLTHAEKRIRAEINGDRLPFDEHMTDDIQLTDESMQRIIERVKRKIRKIVQ